MIDIKNISTHCTRSEFVGKAVLDTIGLVISGIDDTLLKEMNIGTKYHCLGLFSSRTGAAGQLTALDDAVKATNTEVLSIELPMFLSGMINVSKDLYEAAAIDGANGLARIWYVTIPMLSGTTFFIVITSVINSFKVFGLINLMTHGGPGTATTMLVYNIYRTAFQFGKLEFASAQGIVLLAIIFFITWLQFRIQKRNEE